MLWRELADGLNHFYQHICYETMGCRSVEFMYWITGEGTRIFFLLCGNYAGSTKQHELTFCAQALRKQNMNYAGTARNQPPQPTLAQHNKFAD